QLNGVKDHPVLVRHDLVEASADAIEHEFLEENVHRRQLDKLEQARIWKRLVEIEMGGPIGRHDIRGKEKAQARGRKILKKSGKTVQRNLNVLEAPREVQEAYRAGKLPLVVAARVASLQRSMQMEIASRLRAGEAPKDVVAAFPGLYDGQHRPAYAAV